MPLIKIIVCEDNYDESYGDSHRVIDSITDWEEVSYDDLKLLRNHIYDLTKSLGYSSYRTRLVILEKDTEPVVKRITDLKEIVAVKLKKAEADKKRRSDAAKLSKAKREATKRANELAKLKDLAEKHGVTVAEPPGGWQGAT